MDIYESVRYRWDEVAATYDLFPEPFPHTRAQEAHWSVALIQHLTPLPARILDVRAEALSARRFYARDAVRDPRIVALLLDMVLRWSQR
jgi:hypothetical protein